ncbi:MAG: hypothetical protein QXG01_01310 [Candidatus Bathyarchaeia archaeon]
MFRVNILAKVLQEIAMYSKKPYEQIGLLMGNLKDEELWIVDVVHGEGNSFSDSATMLSPSRIARVADDILSGRIEGRIVGWYHSHIGSGIFMSDVDIETQLRLQQFSPYVVGLVIDSLKNEFGIFVYDALSGIVQIPRSHIRIV